MSEASEKKADGGLVETVKIIIQALVLALLVRTFAFQPFNIPSGSMENTLLIGDYLFVSKYSYGYSRFSFPFSPHLFDGRIFGHPPKRGDIIVFKLPRDETTDYIKRVVGLPGDKIQVIHSVLYINGKAVPRKEIGPVTLDGVHYTQYQETMPNGVKYKILQINPNGPLDNTQVYEVPPNHYFMMGDNRDNSTDSRVPPTEGGVGYVPFENLIGKAQIIFFSIKEGAPVFAFWEWPWTVRWNRIFKGL